MVDRTKIAKEIAERDGGWYCYYCGAELVDSRDYRMLEQYEESDGSVQISYSWSYPPNVQPFTFDHVIARSNGGNSNPENLRLACKSCNSSKGAR